MNLSDLVGQETAAAVLANAIQRGQVAHAYLFTGPAGVGKRAAALCFAKALNCLGLPPAGSCCDTCRHCTEIDAGVHPDVRLVTPAANLPPDAPAELLDALGERAEIGIGQIRQDPTKPQTPPPLLQDAYLRPHSAAYKVYVIDPADRLNPFAANALLKLLEEPPEAVVLILVSSRQAALLPTILSRCQQVQFRLAPLPAIEALLLERGAEPDRARLLAALSAGRPGWAITAWRHPEQLATRDRVLDYVQGLADLTPRAALRAAAELRALAAETWAAESQAETAPETEEDEEEGEERAKLSPTRVLRMRVPQLLEIAQGWYRDLLVCQAGAPELVVNADRRVALEKAAGALSPAGVAQALAALEQAKRRLQRNANVDLALDGLLLTLTRLS